MTRIHPNEDYDLVDSDRFGSSSGTGTSFDSQRTAAFTMDETALAHSEPQPQQPVHPSTMTSHGMLPVMYEKLRRLAASKMFRESGLQTLQPTALVHEAWLRLKTSKSGWDSHAHFFGAAAEAMRRILVDRSRRKSSIKRQLTEDVVISLNGDSEDRNHILAIHEALQKLEMEDSNAASIVALKFFSGLSSEEIAHTLHQSVRTVERQWTFAKARLFQIIQMDLKGQTETQPA